MGYIYLITNTVNGKQYVGQTIRKNIETRWNQHRKCDAKSCGSYLLRAYKKYGIEKFKFQIICICFDEVCNQLEMEYIKKFNTLSPNGYNLKEGGHNSKHHPDTIKLLSDKNTGKNNPQYGREWTQEEKDKIWTPEARKNRSKAVSGDKNPNYGKKCNHRKQVIQYDTKGNTISIYDSIAAAAKDNNLFESCIRKVCIGKIKTSGGFIWKFL